MNIDNLIERIITEVSVDDRVEDGIFNAYNDKHMDALREYLIRRGIEENVVLEFTNKMIEGKYPERQAYNKNGILVTFPTPEYKQRAIKAGTHFEKDPTKAPPNVFNAPTTPTEPVQVSTPTTDQPASSAPQQAPAATTIQQQPIVEPSSAPSQATPTPPEQKGPQEKSAEKDYVKKIIGTGDDTLQRKVDVAPMTSNLNEQLVQLRKLAEQNQLYNAAIFLTEHIK